jgi:ubiquinone/menaquinone biosynthesis C-methylase UbiE
MINSENKYTKMQLDFYEYEASQWSEENPNPVVHNFDGHNNWDDYELLFKNFNNQSELVGLDFACGPGRNIVKYKNRFKRLDGVDISQNNINNAHIYLKKYNIESNLYVCNGVDLSSIQSDTYDFVMSTIALQHICVYEIRYNYFKEFYRVLKSGGFVAIQMGFGSPSPMSVGYYENYYDATGTNRRCDVCIESPSQLEKDLKEIGFINFDYTIGKVGPGDLHPNWIYFNATK